MVSRIYPRSPREMMDGWVHLPRLVDKIRLHLEGALHPDYQENFLQGGFDAHWFQSAGVSAEQLVTAVRGSLCDGQVYDWVRTNVRRSPQEKAQFNNYVLTRGSDEESSRSRLQLRKAQSGLANRDDIQTFVSYIDADEGRL